MADLQAHIHVNQLLEEHKNAKVPQNEENASTSSGNITIFCCSKHDEKEIELYCNTCEETICLRCTIKDENHHSHDYEDLNKAIERKITASLEPMERQLTTITKVLKQLDARRDQISDQQATIESRICNTITRLQWTLEVRKTELISQLHQLTQAKLKSLAAQRDQIETTQVQLNSCLLFLRENLKTGNQGKVLC